MRYFLLLTVLFVGSYLHADEQLYLQLGGGVQGKGQSDISQVKQFEVGIQKPIWLLSSRLAGGGWIDTTHKGARSSGYLAGYLGLEPTWKGLYVHWYSGVSGITHRDTALSTHFQFVHDLGFGFRDVRGVGVGVYVKHFSNASIKQPNYGRNFIGVHLQLPLIF